MTSASIDARAEISGPAFSMRALTRTRGVMDVLVGFRSDAKSTAVVENGRAVPTEHTAINKWRGKDRHVYLRYNKGAIVSSDVFPSAADDDRQEVPEELKKSTVDPLTAALSLMVAAGADKGCADQIPVFDGRRRYDLVCTASAEASEAAGTVFQRSYLFSIVAGRQKHPFWPQSKTPKALTLWFEKVDPRLPPIVVRIAARSGLIGYSVSLNRLRIDGQDLQFTSR